jgi:ATP-dependent DNA ligase
MSNHDFSKLYTIDKKNLVREWEIKVVKHNDYSEIITKFGTLNGKQITNITKIDKGKNIGKKNETSHYEQAISEAKSKWTKKKDIEKYTLTIPNTNENINTNENDTTKNVNLSPMLAHEYKKYKDKLIFPCFIQKKYDGYRMLYNNETQDLYSRNGKKYDALYNTPLHNQLKQINLPLDGEIYCHDPSITFESYGILRKKKIKQEDIHLLHKLEYHVYDIHIQKKTYTERLEILKNIFTSNSFTNIKLVDTFICQNENEINQYHESFIKMKYEGSILRNKDGFYSSKRSFDLLKYKDFDDDEFEIIDYTFESDNDIKLIVWICKTKENKSFNIRPQGTKGEREILYNRGKDFIGQKLWVKFFGYTDNNIPRFPVTKTNSYKSYIRNIKE